MTERLAMNWARNFLDAILFPNLQILVDRTLRQVEEPAWSLVERRAAWLGAAELRGYIRARTRPLIEREIVRQATDLTAGQSARIREIVSEQLIDRGLARAAMLQFRSEIRRAA